MKTKELRNKSPKELEKSLVDMQTQLATVVVEYRTKEVKNVKQIAGLKKTIARIHTIIREQEIAGETK